MESKIVFVGWFVAAMMLPGCIAQEIRDELRSANAQLVCVQFAMEEANAGLSSANTLLAETNDRLDLVEEGLARLDRTNALIDDVEKGLGRIDSTNTSLGGLERQLALLTSIEQSLDRLDVHLASVRKTIGSINSFIPFLDLGGGYEETEVSAATQEEVPPPGLGQNREAADAAPGENGGAEVVPASPLAARRDSIMGAWISVYPDRSVAMVIHADGTYEKATVQPPRAASGGTPEKQPGSVSAAAIVRGNWARDGSTVSFATVSEKPDGTGSTHGMPPPIAWVVKVLSVTSRALAIETPDGMVVFGRP